MGDNTITEDMEPPGESTQVAEPPPFIQDYSDVIELLPLELHRSLSLLKELDDLLQTQMLQVKSKTASYHDNRNKISFVVRKRQKSEIRMSVREIIKIAEEKVGLSRSTYDMVDRYVRRLDEDLQRMEDEQICGSRITRTLTSQPSNIRRRRKNLVKTLAEVKVGGGRDGGRNGKRRAPENTESETVTGGSADMPVDPNEPHYCYCNQVSFGEMVACDNEDCPLEWFHYDCVKLSAPPKGAWYCKLCSSKGDRATKKDRRF